MLVVGSSVQVYSAFRLVRAVAERGAPVALLNNGPTRADALAALHLHCAAEEVLPALASRLLARRDADDAEVFIDLERCEAWRAADFVAATQRPLVCEPQNMQFGARDANRAPLTYARTHLRFGHERLPRAEPVCEELELPRDDRRELVEGDRAGRVLVYPLHHLHDGLLRRVHLERGERLGQLVLCDLRTRRRRWVGAAAAMMGRFFS